MRSRSGRLTPVVTNSEKPRVGPGQELIRRLKRSWVIRRGDGLRVLPEAFMPIKKDVAGISLFRATVVDAGSAACQGLTKPDKHGRGVGVITSDVFLRLGLELIADDDPVEGHTSVPALSWHADLEAEEDLIEALADRCDVRSWHQVPGGQQMDMPPFDR